MGQGVGLVRPARYQIHALREADMSDLLDLVDQMLAHGDDAGRGIELSALGVEQAQDRGRHVGLQFGGNAVHQVDRPRHLDLVQQIQERHATDPRDVPDVDDVRAELANHLQQAKRVGIDRAE